MITSATLELLAIKCRMNKWLYTIYAWSQLQILQGEASGWRTILKDVQHCMCT